MKKIYRQLLLFTSTVIFMALAPLVVFYAVGYRVSIDASDDLLIGAMIIESNPRRAQVIIDGQDIGTTPQSVPNLPPGEHQVSISSDGYATWQKRLSVEPIEVTELRNIRLFPEDTSPETILNNVSKFTVAPNRQLIAALADQKLHIISDDGTPVIVPISIDASFTRFLWSPDSNNILLIGQKKSALFNVTAQTKPKSIPALADQQDLAWDPRIPGRVLALSTDGQLTAYQMAGDATTLIASQVHSFATSSRHIYLTSLDQLTVTKLNLQGVEIDSFIMDEPIKSLIITPSGDIAVWYDSGHLALYEDGETIAIADQVQKVGYSPDGQLLYLQTDVNSLHVYNAGDDRIVNVQ